MQLILASASPRRNTLLRCVGASPVVRPVDVEECLLDGEAPADAVVRLARMKAETAHDERNDHDANDLPSLVLAADTLVAVDGRVLGKPGDTSEARAMLAALSGRRHEVFTGVWLIHAAPTAEDRATGGYGRTFVRFRDLDAATIAAYVASGEPLDKAGAYGVQELGALLVAGIDGSWSNVVGLPLERLPGWLSAIGVAPGAVFPWLA